MDVHPVAGGAFGSRCGALEAIGRPLCRAQPHIVIELFFRRGGFRRLIGQLGARDRAYDDSMQLADSLVAHQFASQAKLPARTLLRTELEYYAVSIHRLSQGLCNRDVHIDGLFHIHILALLRGLDGDQAVPVLGGCDTDGVDIVAGEHLAKVLMSLESGAAAVTLLGKTLSSLAELLTKIAHGHHPDIIISKKRPEMSAAHTANAYTPHRNPLARRRPPPCANRRRRNDIGKARGGGDCAEATF